VPNVLFVGRLATYRYYNMDQVIGQALATFRRIGEERAIQNQSAVNDQMILEAALARQT
jgi:UDP-galactopyranose mutase